MHICHITKNSILYLTAFYTLSVSRGLINEKIFSSNLLGTIYWKHQLLNDHFDLNNADFDQFLNIYESDHNLIQCCVLEHPI